MECPAVCVPRRSSSAHSKKKHTLLPKTSSNQQSTQDVATADSEGKLTDEYENICLTRFIRKHRQN